MEIVKVISQTGSVKITIEGKKDEPSYDVDICPQEDGLFLHFSCVKVDEIKKVSANQTKINVVQY